MSTAPPYAALFFTTEADKALLWAQVVPVRLNKNALPDPNEPELVSALAPTRILSPAVLMLQLAPNIEFDNGEEQISLA